jgi:hypothetical protein
MKSLFILLIISVSMVSCITEQKTLNKRISISVIDKANGLAVGNAQVQLITIVNALDIYNEIQQTNASGQCIFLFELKPDAQYSIYASRDGYLGYIEDDSVNISKSYMQITANTAENISLYLTSDSMHQVEYYRKSEKRYEIPELIELLKTGKFRGGIPVLHWEDIPQLIAVGNDSTKITSFPINPLSSAFIEEVPLGMLSMWFIESIRKSEGNRFILPYEKYPSLNPRLKCRNEYESNMSELVKMKKATQAYSKWWDFVKNLDPVKSSKINPLDGTDLSWN